RAGAPQSREVPLPGRGPHCRRHIRPRLAHVERGADEPRTAGRAGPARAARPGRPPPVPGLRSPDRRLRGATGDGVRGRRLAAALALLLGGASLLATQVPFVWALREGRLARRPETGFPGALATYADECFTYWSWMRQAREGRFLFEDLYTTEPHPRNYVNLLFWTLGTVSRVTGASVRAVYASSRVALAGALLLALWAL